MFIIPQLEKCRQTGLKGARFYAWKPVLGDLYPSKVTYFTGTNFFKFVELRKY